MARLSDLLNQDPQNGYISMAELDALERAQRGQIGQIPGALGPGQGSFQRAGGNRIDLTPQGWQDSASGQMLAPTSNDPRQDLQLDYANPLDYGGAKGYRLKGDSTRALLNDGRMVDLVPGRQEAEQRNQYAQQQAQAKQEAAALEMELKRADLDNRRAGEWHIDSASGMMINKRSGEIKPIGGMDGARQPKLSATSEKELYEADEMANASQGVLGSLKAAKELNSKAYSGAGALLRAKIASNFPGKTDSAADATIQLDNIIREQALTGMKSIFGGNPTEGERAILMEIQASADKTPEQRAAIIDRATQLAERRLKFNEGKASMIRGGGVRSGMPKLEEPAPAQPAGRQGQIPPGAVQKLMQNPALKEAFDQKYGQGASAFILSGG